jgi:SAM-dependent methyltransferase
MITQFHNDAQSHEHARKTLDMFYEFDDFMESIGTLCDLGCGSGLDLEWWATCATRDETPRPLNIRCTGIDLVPRPAAIDRCRGARYLQCDIEGPLDFSKRPFDVLWCHDTFQYLLNPLQTLRQWRSITADNGMLCIVVPQTTNLEFNIQAFDQPSGVYYHWTLVSLIHALAVSGWDCAAGFFRKLPDDPWLHAVVYRSDQEPRDPRTTSWYELGEAGLLPESAARSVLKHGYLRQRDLTLPWMDKSFMDFRRH